MENINDFNELEEIRQQIKALKDKVERKGTLNERLVRKSIKGSMSSIRRTIYILLALAVLVTPLWLMIKFQHNLSWPLFIFTMVMMYGSVFFDWHINRLDTESIGTDLKETARKLAEMKKRRSKQEKIGLFVVVPIWLIWLALEFYYGTSNHTEALALIIGMVVGGVIGGAIGLSIYFKWQRKNDEMIDQINEILEEE